MINCSPVLSRRRGLQLALGCFAGAFIPAPSARAQTFRRVGIAFGTRVSILVQARSEAQACSAFDASFAEIRHIDHLAGLVRPDSALFQLNRDGVINAPDPALIEMLDMAQVMYRATEGFFDVTVQPLWRALDIAAKSGTWPDEPEIQALCQRVDQRAMTYSNERIVFTRPGMGMTLNSLARGLAADRVSSVLEAHEIANAFLDTDVLQGLGAPEHGRPWRATIRDPRNPTADVGTSGVNGFLATSGDYQYFWSPDFRRNHILDPHTGASPQDFASVSVIASSGLLADALSTAVFLIGREKAARLLATFKAEGFFVAKNGKSEKTEGFPLLMDV